MHIEDRLYQASKANQAGAELWRLYNSLADDVAGDELLSRFDAYVSDLGEEAQALYRKLIKEGV